MASIGSIGEIPSGIKYLLIRFFTTQVNHEADERSKTHPGHGYPAYTETLQRSELFGFLDYPSLEAELIKLYSQDQNRKDIVVLEVGRVLPVKHSISVDLG